MTAAPSSSSSSVLRLRHVIGQHKRTKHKHHQYGQDILPVPRVSSGREELTPREELLMPERHALASLSDQIIERVIVFYTKIVLH